MIVRIQKYYERIGEVEGLCRSIIRRVEHIYYKNDSINNALEKKVSKQEDGSIVIDSSSLLHQLCSFLYKNADGVVRTRALLCHIFHHALHDRYFKVSFFFLFSNKSKIKSINYNKQKNIK